VCALLSRLHGNNAAIIDFLLRHSSGSSWAATYVAASVPRRISPALNDVHLLKRQTIVASSVPLLRISSIMTYLWVAMDERRCDDERGKARVSLAPA
jgi:hypothetical protein